MRYIVGGVGTPMNIFFWLISILLPCPAVLADTIWMKNGDRLTGIIEELTADQVRIVLIYGSSVIVKRDQIKRWRFKEQSNSSRVIKTDIILPATKSDDKSALLWTGSGDFNLKIKDRDNKKTNDANLKSSTEISHIDWRYGLDGEYIYETTNNATNSHEYRLKPTVDFFLDQHWFGRVAADIKYNMLEPYYFELGYIIGPGYRFWSERARRLELILQAGLERTHYRAGYWNNSGIFDADIINYPFLDLSWDSRQQLLLWSAKMELFSKGDYRRYVSQPSHYLKRERSAQGSIGLRYYFNDHIRLSWSSELSWEDVRLEHPEFILTMNTKEWRHLISLGAKF